ARSVPPVLVACPSTAPTRADSSPPGGSHRSGVAAHEGHELSHDLGRARRSVPTHVPPRTATPDVPPPRRTPPACPRRDSTAGVAPATAARRPPPDHRR